ncbi:L-threonylcarbamoyladenylate synthase [Brochothrix campestris]|uniref:Threonylcarbamoyl-AMP synthase n=1 Tax=Brochothrix campestris FSL F6-1037 TaxID=1265861 RepID=W7CTN1_9LIST|nr:L-threonylcarbamoyladenylate synthase [Brochothrix campestris]EUJ40060.1 Sua5/YciO/YrdC/YwlC family protein [Brochothrix campestris FSL F6-1037]
METVFLKASTAAVATAAQTLQAGELVAFPTETVYGLGGDATQSRSVKKIYKAKGRPSDNPLIVHIAERHQLDAFVTTVSDQVEQLMESFWPGPLTLLMPVKDGALAPEVTAGLATVAVRMPSHPLALALLKETGLPIAAPSANTSGKPSPTKARHVQEDLNGRIACILDGGSTGVGVESTVVDCTGEKPVILRPGGVTKEALEAVIGPVLTDAGLKNATEKPKAPGMKYTHYAPQAPVYLVDGTSAYFQACIDLFRLEGEVVGVLATDETLAELKGDVHISTGQATDLESVAAHLYDGLRAFNHHEEVTVILAEVYDEAGIGQAVMNRLEKAAGHRYLRASAR